jgi:tRNA threonylcarbamoyladenosine biosynthesis protein TsaE
LRNASEAFDIGLEDMLYDSWYCVIEWPQIVESMLPADAAKINIDILGESSRRILIL